MIRLPQDAVRFLDTHQDMDAGIGVQSDGFEAYYARFLDGPCKASLIWSSLFPSPGGQTLVAQLEAHSRLLEEWSSQLRLVSTTADLEASDPRTGVLPHSEGLELPGVDVEAINSLWAQHGLRSLSLTWKHETSYGFSSYDDPHIALKPKGRRLIGSLERSSIMLDLAHLNEHGFFDALSLFGRPVLVSHTACQAIVNHPRNLSDAQLRALGEHGGLVGLSFYPVFLGLKGSIEAALAHIDRIASLAGEDSVAVGSDWGATPAGEVDGTVALRALIEAVGKRFGPEMATKFSRGNAQAFLLGQLPHEEHAGRGTA